MMAHTDYCHTAPIGHRSYRLARQEERAKAYRERHPDVPVVEALDRKIIEQIDSGGGHLNMGFWHLPDETHCRAGWAITLAGETGRRLEQEHGPSVAGGMIYRASVGHRPSFHCRTAAALADIRARAAEQGYVTQRTRPLNGVRS